MKFASVFPGQGAQAVGMLSELAAVEPRVRATFEEASEGAGVDLWSLIADGPAAALNRTENTQPAMLAAGVAVWRVWVGHDGPTPAAMAGHSFGEYTALVCAGALELAPAAALVRERGRAMQAGVSEGEGAMAAVLGLEDAQVVALCADTAGGEVVEAVNFNAPGQVVIAGQAAAVERAMAQATQMGAKRVMRLEVSVPAHCALMRPAAERFAAVLGETALRSPEVPVLHNADVASYAEPAAIRDALTRQLYTPVRWRETIERLVGDGIQLVVELGRGKVLTGLNRRIDKNLGALCVQDPASLEQGLARCRAPA